MKLYERLLRSLIANDALLPFCYGTMLFFIGKEHWNHHHRSMPDALPAILFILISFGLFGVGIHCVLCRFSVKQPVSQ